ncbi:UDP-N-acetylmuramoyl-L-alanine--D-glutamate ligase [Caldisalinibacter kiritimatiensis]|uniref:UDP-N-acetylmuramoylalanine--D-glutamate ligase n=1 Tax=Caldisalinibacter kiritimatiensis TaxID=1304284 RepID=R1CXA4_9FIRM|nr:UDP-N-acetylmuramoyl-L-alanine--D-glutamate ligase [Caldisalinibacter kiritimatiensis]EOD01259.1 UDP-N-acetylmuramoylalanine--D-glutamate ligase [Caldisalinibacter kiritimatiensis]
MELENKNVLVLGLGVSGVSTTKALVKLGANVIVNDSKTEEDLKSNLKELEGLDVVYKLGNNDIKLGNIDLIVKSPGVPLTVPLLHKANELGIEVITDIELAYRIAKNPFVAITGTNGKTTTTTLIGELFKNCGKNCKVAGNIGVGLLWEVVNCEDKDIFVIETSSFQLESTKYFKPKVSVIINITPDHLKWHKSFENYINAKKKIFKKQGNADFTVLNYDDGILRNLEKEIKSNVIYFSQKKKLDKGVYIDGDYIVIDDGEVSKKVIKYKDIKIPGKHNVENSLAAVCVGWLMGVPIECIKETLYTFEGVEHRLEFVEEIDGIKFYNDSKGTNPDASIRAIEAINKPIILIAGGLDKGSEFDEFIKSFNGKVKALILLGETAEKIKGTAIRHGFNNIYIVDNMRKAVNKAFDISEKGDNVVLSPACASWDMYNSYEERGKDFKSEVEKLRGH